MWSFEVHHVDVAQKLRKVEGAEKAGNVAYEPPLTLLFFEGHQHDVPQRITFSFKIDYSRKSFFLHTKNWTTSGQKVPLHPAAENGHHT